AEHEKRLFTSETSPVSTKSTSPVRCSVCSSMGLFCRNRAADLSSVCPFSARTPCSRTATREADAGKERTEFGRKLAGHFFLFPFLGPGLSGCPSAQEIDIVTFPEGPEEEKELVSNLLLVLPKRKPFPS
ncbi:MAG: uncharacterized protein A8A55_3480, partial [Amphiamblys sp. WSBS2006]